MLQQIIKELYYSDKSKHFFCVTGQGCYWGISENPHVQPSDHKSSLLLTPGIELDALVRQPFIMKFNS